MGEMAKIWQNSLNFVIYVTKKREKQRKNAKNSEKQRKTAKKRPFRALKRTHVSTRVASKYLYTLCKIVQFVT